MCGILGWFGQPVPDDIPRFESALDLLAHRGPDDRGVFADTGVLLGHRRLAILDLSAAGHQPMIDQASGAVIVFNGEIYNHLELRTELEVLGHRFIGHSDTEVLLHALVEWGVETLPRLNGMWAFGFWEPRRRRLLLARDRFGVKPLYYSRGPEGLAFASEPKALLQLFPKYRAVSEEVLLDFLVNNRLYSNGRSFYQGIYVMPPAHYATYEPDVSKLQVTRFWDYPLDVTEELNADDAIGQFDELFSDAVRLRLRSDVPIGLTLSGGLDSTGVLAAAVRYSSQPPTCFTSVYSEREKGELDWAKRASEACGAPLIPVAAPQQEWLSILSKVVWHMDGPGYSPAVYPLWRLMQQARSQGVPVLLEGQGADEALAGYPQYAILDLLCFLSGAQGVRRSVKELITRLRMLTGAFSLRWTAAWLMRELSPTMLRLHRRRVGFRSLLRKGIALSEAPERSGESDGERVRQRLLADHARNILPGLLHYGDAVSMAHSVEARHPFMDYRLVEWMFRLPTRYKLNHGETKWVLREYLRAHGQQAIGDRRDKKGYPTPTGSWLASDTGHEVEHLLVERRSLLHEWCEPTKIARLIEQNRQGVIAAEHHLYKLVSTQMWLNTCIEGNAQ